MPRKNSNPNKGTPEADGPRRKWVIWSAVSSLPQAKEISLGDQRAKAREIVAQHEGVVVDELEVPGESRSIVLFEDACERIPAYARLRDLLRRRAFDVLIYLDRSRLGRTAALVMTIAALCEEAGVTLYEMDAPPARLDAPRSYADDLVGAIRAVGAQQEVEKLRDRHRMGMAGRVKKGLLPGKVPFGYVKTYDLATGAASVEADPVGAPVVQDIFRLFLSGHGTRAIADHLNAAGVPSPQGKTWGMVNVRALLRRCWVYAGFVELAAAGPRPFLREPGRHPALIGEADAVRTAAEMEQRARNHHLGVPHLLSGVCICAHCGGTLIVNTFPAPDRKAGRYLGVVCRSEEPHSQRQTSVRFILPGLRAALAWLAKEADLDALLTDATDTTARAAVVAAEEEVKRHRQQVYDADTLLVSGVLDADRHAAQVRRIEANLAAAQERLARARMDEAQVRHRGERRHRIEEARQVGLAMLDHPDVAQANAWLRAHVRVFVGDGRVTDVEFI